jgi:hypothetical protein
MSENVWASTSHNPKGLHALYRDNFTITFYLSTRLYGVISQKIIILITTSVRTSNVISTPNRPKSYAWHMNIVPAVRMELYQLFMSLSIHPVYVLHFPAEASHLRVLSFGILCHVDHWNLIDVLEEHVATIFRVEKETSMRQEESKANFCWLSRVYTVLYPRRQTTS